MPPNSLTLTIPVRTKNPTNNREHWRVVSKRSKAQRGAAGHVVRSAAEMWMRLVPIVVTMTRVAPSAGLDDDAIPPALKSIRDGVADAINAGIDRTPRIEWRYRQRRGEWGVEITIERKEISQ